jgi:uncharacterized damage-inducible protein DinB
MQLADALLASWDKQAEIIDRIAARADEALLDAKATADGWTVAFHLCHIHETRYYWLGQVGKARAESLGDVFTEQDGEWIPSRDVGHIRAQLAASAKAVRDATADLIAADAEPAGPYFHAVHFLGHMVWHEGWHAGLILTAFRQAGREDEEWENENVWGLWRAYG